MFYSLSRLVEDYDIVAKGGSKMEVHSSLGSIEEMRRKAWFRIITKLAMTFIIIGICAVLVNTPDALNIFLRLGYVGFGFVIGYWFR